MTGTACPTCTWPCTTRRAPPLGLRVEAPPASASPLAFVAHSWRVAESMRVGHAESGAGAAGEGV